MTAPTRWLRVRDIGVVHLAHPSGRPGTVVCDDQHGDQRDQLSEHPGAALAGQLCRDCAAIAGVTEVAVEDRSP